MFSFNNKYLYKKFNNYNYNTQYKYYINYIFINNKFYKKKL